jgi:hypothetical protein
LFVLIGCYYSGGWDEGVFCDKNRRGKMVRFNRVASGRCLCMGILGSSHVGEKKPNTRPWIPSQSKIVKSPPSTHELLLLRHAATNALPSPSSSLGYRRECIPCYPRMPPISFLTQPSLSHPTLSNHRSAPTTPEPPSFRHPSRALKRPCSNPSCFGNTPRYAPAMCHQPKSHSCISYLGRRRLL